MMAMSCAAIGIVFVALWWYRYGTILTPDGRWYIAIANGANGVSPFRWRVMPRVLGLLSPPYWHWASWAALVASAVMVGELAQRHNALPLLAAGLFVTLPWYRGLVRCPILTDQLGMAFALGAALAPWWAAIPLAILAGSCHERAPVFAAVFAWSPIPLIGLLVPMVAAILTRNRGAAVEPHNDWRAMRALHNRAPLMTYLLPWGVCLLAAASPSWQVLASVGIGYATMAVATDRARMYQAGAPIVVIAAASVIPAWASGLAVVSMMVMPWTEWREPWK